MRKSLTYIILSSIAGCLVLAAFLIIIRRMPDLSAENLLKLYEENVFYDRLTIHYPENETLFPPEIVAPTFRWTDDGSAVDAWLVTITFPDDKDRLNVITREPQWTPDPNQWQDMKQRSLEDNAEILILGVNNGISTTIRS
ncbi:MAG: hypothetical protein JXM79_14165, partial [Sedimentisphaerales bacterium]|nr:hypothetical protein [Sedimentisphaerales bacterium]